MDKINNEIEGMYLELMADNVDGINRQTSFDFTSIRDSFRQHVNNRRNTNASDLVLLETNLVESLIILKEKSFELLLNFRNVRKTSTSSAEHPTKTFSSFEEFVNFVVNQQEILNSEQWKLEAIFNYLNHINLESSPSDDTAAHQPSVLVSGNKICNKRSTQ